MLLPAPVPRNDEAAEGKDEDGWPVGAGARNEPEETRASVLGAPVDSALAAPRGRRPVPVAALRETRGCCAPFTGGDNKDADDEEEGRPPPAWPANGSLPPSAALTGPIPTMRTSS